MITFPTEESPLRRVPSNLNPQQSLFLDGIRYAVEMSHIAYTRLEEGLWLATQQIASQDEKKKFQHAPLFLDAWAFVDTVHRLRELLQQMPGVRKKQTGWLRAFFDKTAGVEDLRHVAQHLRREVRSLADLNHPIHGLISWYCFFDTPEGEGRSSVIVSGKVRTGANYPLINPSGKLFRNKVDYVQLTCKKLQVSLTDVYIAIIEVVRQIEDSLRPKLEGLPVATSDLCISLVFAAVPEEDKVKKDAS